MFNFIYNFIFLISSIYLLVKAVFYGIYEIKNENNKYGGIAVIAFSLLVTVFVNIVIWVR